jgi:ABC-type transporter Mla subunit MlaD
MAQAPLQTYNNALLNILGQQQGQAANIYGQQAGQYANYGNALANYLASMQQQSQQRIGIPQSGVKYNGGGQPTMPF